MPCVDLEVPFRGKGLLKALGAFWYATQSIWDVVEPLGSGYFARGSADLPKHGAAWWTTRRNFFIRREVICDSKSL
jgi:hypothetical protein